MNTPSTDDTRDPVAGKDFGAAVAAHLDDAACWQFLRSVPAGRLGVADDQGRPDVLPVTTSWTAPVRCPAPPTAGSSER